MAIKRCIKEHAYDDQVYKSCPICNNTNIFVETNSNSLRLPIEYLNDGYILNSRYIIEKVFEEDFMCITYLALDNQTNNRVLIDELYPQKLVFRNCNDTCNISYLGTKQEKIFNIGFTLMRDEGDANRYNSVSSPVDCIKTNHTIYLVYNYLEWQTLENFISTKNEELSANEILAMVESFTLVLTKMHKEKKFHGNILSHKALVSGNNEILLTKTAYTRIKYLKEFQRGEVPFQDNDTIKIINEYVKTLYLEASFNKKDNKTDIPQISYYEINEMFDTFSYAILIKRLITRESYTKLQQKEINNIIFKKDSKKKKKALEFIESYFFYYSMESISISNFYDQIRNILFTPAVSLSNSIDKNKMSVNIDSYVTEIENKIKRKEAFIRGVKIALAIIFAIFIFLIYITANS